MSKKLDSILAKLPPATVSEQEESNNQIARIDVESYVRIVAVVPLSLKREMKMYLATHQDETEKTLILKGLQSLGFSVAPHELKDNRGKK